LKRDLNKIGFGIGSINIIENNQNLVTRDLEIKFNQNFPEHAIYEEKCIFFKDKANITDKSYHIFRRSLNLKDRTSSLYFIKKQRKKKSLSLVIKPLDTGFYRDPVKMIKEKVSRYVKTFSQGDGFDLVKIQLGCDGANLYRNVKLVNFVFSVINEKVDHSSGDERELNRFVELEINYSFCNDMKMNLVILGLKAANSNWPCLHCTVSKNNLTKKVH